MLLNYLKIIIRNSVRNKFHSLLNIFCLILGLSGFFILMNYVIFETSYDKFHENAKNIYILTTKVYKSTELVSRGACTPGGLGPTLKKEFPEVLETVRLRIPMKFSGKNIVSYHNRNFIEKNILFADSSFFKIFSFQMIKGNPEVALNSPNSVVLTQSCAKKYFGDEDPMNKLLTIKNRKSNFICKVTGIIREPPFNTNIKFNVLASLDTYFNEYNRKKQKNSWGIHTFYTFLKLVPNTNPKTLETRFFSLVEKKIPSSLKNHNRFEYTLLPLVDYHLTSYLRWSIDKLGSRKNVYFLSIMALFVLAISLINYSNLSTARAIKRARETGVRKVLGGDRAQIMFQFFFESFIMNFIAFIFAILFVIIFSSFFYQQTGKIMPLLIFGDKTYWLGIVVLFLVNVSLSGWYPAFVLSSFKPITVLKGKGNFNHLRGGIVLRKTFIVFQFVLALFFIIGTLISYCQMEFMKNYDIGFDKDQVIIITRLDNVQDSIYVDRIQYFYNEIQKYANISGICGSTFHPGRNVNDVRIFRLADSKDDLGIPLQCITVNYNFFTLYQIQFLSGRNFSKNFGTNNHSVILNEAAIRVLNIHNPLDALHRILFSHSKSFQIIGVVKNYHQEALKRELSPIVFLSGNPQIISHYAIKYNSANLGEIILLIKSKWEEIFSDIPLDYYLLENYFDEQYKEDRQFVKTFGFSAILAIVIACFGILGLSYFDVTQRTKEIGIRKALGASTGNIIFIFLKDIMKLVIVANIISWPITFYFMNNWLRDFAYRIAIPWWSFIISGLLVMVITLLTISCYTIIAAMANPVESLRDE